MSFAFLPLYTGDYLRDTRHLSPERHGVYVLLLIHCWDQQGPLPLDEHEIAGIANCRNMGEMESLRYVLKKFFVRMEDGWYNHRMQREVERAAAISIKRKSAGAKGYQAKAKHLPSKSLASATTLTTIKPNSKPKEESKPLALPAWLPVRLWTDYLDHRRAKRAKVTSEAVKYVIKSLDKLRASGNDPTKVIERSIANGWTGLFPLDKRDKSSLDPPGTQVDSMGRPMRTRI